MEIILLLIALVGWIVNTNGWFIVPTLAIQICAVLGVVILAIKLIIYVRTKRRINKHFKNMF